MNIQDRESAVVAMNEMFYFAMNIEYDYAEFTDYQDKYRRMYIPKFLRDIDWGCHILHMIELWNEWSSKGGVFGGMYAFYAKLDTTNRRKLLEYIIDNYNSGIKI